MVMFQDEAGFGRVSTPYACWVAGKRPCIPCHRIREFRYCYGAVAPMTGEHYFCLYTGCDTACMNSFLSELSEAYPDKFILLICDNATWHHSHSLNVPENIKLTYILPYTPEMNPIEQVWALIRAIGFRNVLFPSLQAVIEKLSQVILGLDNEQIETLTYREWICEIL